MTQPVSGPCHTGSVECPPVVGERTPGVADDLRRPCDQGEERVKAEESYCGWCGEAEAPDDPVGHARCQNALAEERGDQGRPLLVLISAS